MNNVSRLAFGLAFALALGEPHAASAADSAKSTGALTLTGAFSPAPPKQGMETITVTVKDAAGKPVKGATVKIASNMPTMSMSGPTLTAHETGNGVYSAKANLNFATSWTFDVSATANGKSGKTRLSAEVK